MAGLRSLQLVALLACVVSAAGCASWYWTKPGFNPADWNRDSYECERDMRQSGYYGAGWVGASNAQNFYERCLAARGYYKQRADSAAPAAAPAPAAPEYARDYLGPRDSVVPNAPAGVADGDSVPLDQRDPDCSYSADGLLLFCRKPGQ
jgi:hypothetical protein